MKEPQKPHPKLKKYVYYTITENFFSDCNPIQVVVLCKKCINCAEQGLKFSHLEGTIMP